jgi:C4-dicarboxylate-binding protein DctP
MSDFRPDQLFLSKSIETPRDSSAPLHRPVRHHVAKKDNEEAPETIRKSGRVAIVTPSAAELSTWKHAMVPVHKEVKARVGRDIVEAIYKDTGFDPRSY